MIGLDTNLLIRHITQDDSVQSPIASHIFERRLTGQKRGFLSLATILETVWVLDSYYDLTPSEIAAAIERTLQLANLIIQNEAQVFLALHAFRSGKADFADALIAALGQWAGCSKTLTFDRKAARLQGFELVL